MIWKPSKSAGKSAFLYYYLGTIFHPNKTFRALLAERSSIAQGFYAVLIMAILYTFVYAFLIIGGGRPFKPWLDIDPDIYYRYNIAFCAPSMFLGWILAAGVVHTTCRCFTSSGSFEQTLSLFGFGIGVASWTTGFHDLLSSFLGAIHVINQRNYEHALNSPTIWRTILWIQMIAYLLVFIILFMKGVRTVYRFSNWQSLLLGLLGFITYQGFFFIFNR